MRKKILIPLLILFSASLCINGCVQYRESTRVMLEQFADARVENLDYEGRNLRYLSLHRHDTLPTLFFLHGSPSSMSVYNVYYEDPELQGMANIIAADRPGYGFSGLGLSERSVRRQAEKMWKILEQEGYPSPLYIVGSSYGGTVATKMAMLQPEKVDGMLLVSASLAPGKEKTYGISYLIQYPPLRWLIPSTVMVANDEKLSHYQALSEMLPYWERITAPVVLIQGTADRLIFPENVDFAKRNLVNAASVTYKFLEGEGHFLQIKYKDLILEKLQSMMQQNPLSETVVMEMLEK